MASLFISHSSADRQVVEGLTTRLREWGYPSLFMDVDPDGGIAVGSHWEQQLYRELRLADAVVFVASRASTTSSWCQIELALARSAGKPVLPLAIEPGARTALLDDCQWLDMSAGEPAYERLRRDLAARFSARDMLRWDPTRPPYPGLEAFQRQDAAVFFGRDDAVVEVIRHLQAPLGRGRCIGVIGASGSGKSSLVRAGVLPRLASERWVVVPPFTPGGDPTGAAATAIAAALRAAGEPEERSALREPAGFLRAIRTLSESAGERRWVLVVVDQAEELVVQTPADERANFVRALAGALDQGARLCVLSTLRSEFLSASLSAPELVALMGDPVLLGPLDRSRLGEVIAGPARRAGIELAPGLVERMVEDTEGGDALPLLAYTLRALYEQSGDELSMEDYHRLGGVHRALAQQADAVHADLHRRGRESMMLPTLLQLVSIDIEGEPTRRRVRRDELGAAGREVVDAFIDARLLVSRDDGVVEVAHEALLRAWPPLRVAIDASRERLWLIGELERDTAEWERFGRADAYLLRAERLARVRLLVGGAVHELPATAREFYETSERFERRRRRRSIVSLAAVVVVLASAAIASFTEYRQARESADRARAAQREALARSLISAGTASADRDVDQAALLALEGARMGGGDTRADARILELSLMPRLRFAAGSLLDPSGSLSAFAMSEDSRVIATASILSGTVRLWSLARRREIGEPLRARGVSLLALSADGGVLVTGDTKRAIVQRWSTGRRTPIGPPLHAPHGLGAMAISRDAGIVAVTGEDGRMVFFGTPHAPVVYAGVNERIGLAADGRTAAGTYSVADQVMVSSPGRHRLLRTYGPLNVAVSDDGRRVAAATVHKRIRVWDLHSARPAVSAFRSGGLTVALSGDGRTVAGTDGAHTIRAWDVTSRRLLATLRHTSVLDLALSHDGRILATASADGVVRVWDLRAAPLGRTVKGPELGDVAFSLDGRRLITTGLLHADVHLWDATRGTPIGRIRGARDGEATISSNGRTLALSSGGRHARVAFYDPRSGGRIGEARARPNHLVSALLSASGGMAAVTDVVGPSDPDVRTVLWDVWRRRKRARLAVDSDDLELSADGQTVAVEDRVRGRIRLWAVGSPSPSGQIRVPGLFDVVFSPDGRVLATLGSDGTTLWSLPSRRQIATRRELRDWGDTAFSHDSATLAIADSPDGAVQLWEFRRPGRPVTTLPVPGAVALAFSPDNRTLASASATDGVRLWDVHSHRALGQVSGGRVDDVIFDPAGERLATVNYATDVVVLWPSVYWSARSGSIIAWLCPRIRSSLTRAEWHRFVPGEPYHRTCSEP